MTLPRTATAILAAVPLLVLVSGSPAQAQPRLPLIGSVVPGLERAVRTGAEQDSTRVQLAVSLRLRDEAGLDRLLADQAAGRAGYLTPEQFRDRFAPGQAEVDRVANYLRGQGLTVSGQSANRLSLTVSATAGQVRDTFGTTLSRWQDSLLHREFIAPESAPLLPVDLIGLVSDISGLDQHYVAQHRDSAPVAEPRQVGSGPAGGYTPAELRSGYNLNTVLGTDQDGAGQSLAVLAYGRYEQANIDTFTRNYALNASTPVHKPISGGGDATSTAQAETELDIEVAQAIAPKAALTVYSAPNTAAGEIDMWNAVVADKVPVVSLSWGLCEYDRSPGSMAAVDAVAKQAAAQGMTIFAPSGDAGAYDCERDANTTHAADLAVDFPGSSPYVTSVGGTRLTLDANGARSAETAWNQGGGWAGGGGESTVFDRPSWQPGTGKRQVPDVSATASGGQYSVYRQGKWGTSGGTSASTPLWAGLLTLVNQRAAASGQPPVGTLNPKLYALAGRGLHDITEGENRHYPAATGYDMATGWGSPDGQALTDALINPLSRLLHGR
ncbi:S53 family serine peptidase [Kutzneria viridogrisea]|uniref:Peptidase S53 domain-containing protein n=2 Tax=Kutzneria TaxID=43356 RepID=W5W1M4_9PSEU|nr:S53 family peptidase [Kutzneria albida]AHH94665.1 hypothetical protein KALB_1292 [Kutzneria albida DSM 43870]MBA8930333.1 kumamolisin [Kutzneria viridogrisea]